MIKVLAKTGFVLAVFAVGLLGACQSTTSLGSVEEEIGASTQTDGASPDRFTQEYRLGAADQLKITVFGEPQLSGEFIVDGEGFVSVPLIGEVIAEGRTLREFQTDVEAQFSEGYLREPSINVEVLNFRPFYILGEVNRPGEYPYTNRLTILNAIATAEGFTYRANKKVVIIKGFDDDVARRVQVTPSTRIAPGDTVQVLERLF